MRIIRSLQGDLASLETDRKEKLAAIDAATEELHKFEEQDIEGDELFRIQFKHKKQLLQRVRRRMDEAKTDFDSLKKLKKKLNDELVELDKGSIEDSLPLVVQSKLGKDPVNAWKDVPVRHMMNHGLAESIVDHFNTHGLDTLGKIEEFRKKNEVTTLDGITETMEKKFDAARDEFLAAYNNFLSDDDEDEGADKEAADDDLPTKISSLDIGEDVVKKLKDEGIEDIEQLATYLKKHGQTELMKMVGSRALEKIKDAIK